MRFRLGPVADWCSTDRGGLVVRAAQARIVSLAAVLCFVWFIAGARPGVGEEGAVAAPHARGDSVPAAGFIIGADISFLQEIENHGGVFRENGSAKNLLDILSDHGFNYARLRLWHTPPAGYCGLDSTLVIAARIKAAGLGLLLDLHYSDTWADPGAQSKPHAWEGLAFDSLRDSVYEYTLVVISRLKGRNALPDMVQIGNEITCGMLWDDGRVCGTSDTPEQWAKLGDLIAAGIEGVDAALGPGDSTRIMIHIDRGADIGGATWFFDNPAIQGIDFDVIGLSYYPWWHGTLDEVEATLDSLARRYNRDVIVVETAYPWTLDWYDDTHNVIGLPEQLHPGYPATVGGQEDFLADLMDIIVTTPSCRGRGVFYWAPEYIPVPGMGSPWENLTLFDFDGDLLSSISAFEWKGSGRRSP